MAYSQEPPFCIQVELTEGCNLHCKFCGIQGIRSKAGSPFYFMTPAVAERIAVGVMDLGWTSRIEFAMHGEPTLNPNLAEIVTIFRRHLRHNQLMITSNGGGLCIDSVRRITELFDNGLNILALDDYHTANLVPKIREQLIHSTIRLYDYPDDGLEFSPHRRWPSRTRAVVFVKDLEEAAQGSHAKIYNHAGVGGPPNQKAKGKRCVNPFRELGVQYDGTVAACCQMFRNEVEVGNVVSATLGEIWNGEKFQAFRRILYAGRRDLVDACAGCDWTGSRLGLLPDKLGKATLEPPTQEDVDLISSCKSMRPISIIKRPWEK